MEYFRRFHFLIAAPAFDGKDLEAARLKQIAAEVEHLGFQVVKAFRMDDAELAIRTDAAIGCMLVDWGKKGMDGKSAQMIALARQRGLETPVFLLIRRQRLEEIPADVLNDVDGYVFLTEETPEFIAKNLVSRLKQYAESLRTPFFGALLDYSEEGNHLWTCPGHNGGIFYRRSPIGRIFFEHLGEAVFRDDIDNSVLDLGDLLVHEGPALAAQKAAAEIFGADRTYFVLNGTSSSNKIALSALVAQGDLVLFDRNNHKAAHHGALVLSGGTPIFLETDRNLHGLIGPIDIDALDEQRIREKIRNNPLVKDPEAWKKPRPFRVAVIEQCTYDGTVYSADLILERIGHLCDYVMFDEAWAGFMKFHPLYRGRFAMGLENLGPESPGIIVTQSTHKQLASFSQASQIHIKDRHIRGQRRHVEHQRFNEAFMLYASTSPFYPLFASLDVGAQMMKGRSGMVLWDDTIRLGIELRKKIRGIRREIEQMEQNPDNRWFVDPFVPDLVFGPEPAHGGERPLVPWEDIPTDLLASDPSYWALTPGEKWHGFSHLAHGMAMTDPNKFTLLTPGFDRTAGGYAQHGVPAPVLAQYLRENRIVPEKNDLNSLLFLLTPGVESSKAGTLLSSLVAFKRFHDANESLENVIPEFVRRHIKRYSGMRLKDLCQEMHTFYRDNLTCQLQRNIFRPNHLPTMAMPVHEATQMLTRNQVDYLPLDMLDGRIATTLFVVYPPGIAIIVPGERLDDRAKPMLDYLKVFERGANLFPGFDNEIQGVYRVQEKDGKVRFFTYVAREK
ncbi:MAG: amino acid decarboxylase [Magnetococcales bacterium]|nr:amino acid decarboxylase [Magnetococcales bacterium]